MILSNIVYKIRNLFKKDKTTSYNWLDYSTDYNAKNKMNPTWEASNKVANYVVSESKLELLGDTPQEQYLNEVISKVWRKRAKRITSRALGSAEVSLVPYVRFGEIKTNIISKENIVPLNDNGDELTEIAIILEQKTVDSKQFKKVLHYILDEETKNHTIETLFYNNGELSYIPDILTGWQQENPVIITNCDRLLIGRIVCPVDPRTNSEIDSANITDGAKDLIEEMTNAFNYILDEYNLKKVFVGIDETLLRKDDNGEYVVNSTQIFKLFETVNKDKKMLDVYDPSIRQDPVFKRFLNAGEMLERRIGLSRGIFTNQDDISQYTNQANIKRAVFDTYAFVLETRASIEAGMYDYLYAINALAEYSNIMVGRKSFEELKLSFSWSNSMIETPQEELAEWGELVAMGSAEPAEVRAWAKNITVQKSKEEIAQFDTNVTDNVLEPTPKEVD